MKKKIALVALFLLVSFVGAGLVYGYNTLYKINEMISDSKLDESGLEINHDLDIDTVNIAVFGIDGRSDVEGDRSDTIMIASLDFRNGNVRVSSIMRDLLVFIPESKKTNDTYDKINAAYAYGGAEHAVKTINQNFDLNISDYVIVDFDCMVDTVDALGGVEIDIQSESILDWTNKYIDDVNEKVGKGDPKLEETGPQVVSGVQALAYSRNRYSDDDFHRTERQREVVRGIVKEAFSMDLKTGINLLSKIYPYVQTTLNINEMTSYAKAFLSASDKAFFEFRVPTDKNVLTTMISGISYVVPDTLYDNVIALHDFIYGPTIDDSLKDPTTTQDETKLETTTSENPGKTTSKRVSSDLGDDSESSSSSARNSAYSGTGYTSYVPSARVKKLSEAITAYASSGYWSEDSSQDKWASDQETPYEPEYVEPEYVEPEYVEPEYTKPQRPVYEEEEEEPVSEPDEDSAESNESDTNVEE